jgi:hypothetical protein
MESFEARLNQILPKLTSPELLQNIGLGNEIGFYIFDYPPERELQLREFVAFICEQLQKKYAQISFSHINLFDLIIAYLQERNLLQRVLKVNRDKGDQAALSALKSPLDHPKVAKFFVQQADPANQDLILVSGVGSAFPMLRSHNLLQNLHPLLGSTPLVMFYPGVYSGQDLRLFGRLKQRHYYRAFQLVP